MRPILTRLCAGLLALGLAMGVAACGTRPASTRAVEEKFLGMGQSRKMYEYGEQLLERGKYREAHAAFLEAEQSAYTDDVRNLARERRMWLERAIASLESGEAPPAFTSATLGPMLRRQAAPPQPGGVMQTESATAAPPAFPANATDPPPTSFPANREDAPAEQPLATPSQPLAYDSAPVVTTPPNTGSLLNDDQDSLVTMRPRSGRP